MPRTKTLFAIWRSSANPRVHTSLQTCLRRIKKLNLDIHEGKASKIFQRSALISFGCEISEPTQAKL